MIKFNKTNAIIAVAAAATAAAFAYPALAGSGGLIGGSRSTGSGRYPSIPNRKDNTSFTGIRASTLKGSGVSTPKRSNGNRVDAQDIEEAAKAMRGVWGVLCPDGCKDLLNRDMGVPETPLDG